MPGVNGLEEREATLAQAIGLVQCAEGCPFHPPVGSCLLHRRRAAELRCEAFLARIGGAEAWRAEIRRRLRELA